MSLRNRRRGCSRHDTVQLVCCRHGSARRDPARRRARARTRPGQGVQDRTEGRRVRTGAPSRSSSLALALGPSHRPQLVAALALGPSRRPQLVAARRDCAAHRAVEPQLVASRSHCAPTAARRRSRPPRSRSHKPPSRSSSPPGALAPRAGVVLDSHSAHSMGALLRIVFEPSRARVPYQQPIDHFLSWRSYQLTLRWSVFAVGIGCVIRVIPIRQKAL
jgi:hypothetical protein